MAFFLLLMLTTIYFLRPYEWVPGLIGRPLYLLTILPCILVSSNSWSPQFDARSLSHYPISACVLGLLAIASLSAVFNGSGMDFVFGYSKAIIFYLLLVGIVDSRIKLSIYLQSLAFILFIMATLVILSLHGIITIGNYSAQVSTGSERLSAQGANFDQNDTAALLNLGILVSLHYMLVARPMFLRPVWLCLALTQLYVQQLADSRGGFLALIVGLAVYILVRWGKKGLLWGSCLLPLIVAQIATERMTTVGSAFVNDTGQSRIQFWCSGLLLLKQNFLFGVGPNLAVEHVGKALHNTFVQAFAELGFVGGAIFLGAIGYGLFTTYRLVRPKSVANEFTPDPDPTLPLTCALLAAYAVAILGINHLYATHTYLVLGLASVSARLHESENLVPLSTLFVRFAAGGAAFVVLTHVTARLMVQW